LPFITSIEPIYGTPLVVAMLACLESRPAAALLSNPTAHLFTAGPSPILGSSVPSNFTEAAFTGYAAQPITGLLGPIALPNGDGWAMHCEADFLGGSVAFPGAVILGYWVDNGSGVLYLAEYFQTPIPISAPGDFISLDIIWPINTPASAQ
jgi:hypothetical protein